MGAGASALVVDLVQRGYQSIDAVDLSQSALDQLVRLLGSDADRVRCQCADVRQVRFDGSVDVWHDRATFHFLTATDDQSEYVQRVLEAVPSGGHVVLATFSKTGPEQCSGLPVARHSVNGLCELFGERFELVDSFDSEHTTPWGAQQAFLHVLLRRC
jgi:SAM-dependent methyltransferase